MKYHIFHVFRVVLGERMVQTTHKNVRESEIGRRIRFQRFRAITRRFWVENQLF